VHCNLIACGWFVEVSQTTFFRRLNFQFFVCRFCVCHFVLYTMDVVRDKSVINVISVVAAAVPPTVGPDSSAPGTVQTTVAMGSLHSGGYEGMYAAPAAPSAASAVTSDNGMEWMLQDIDDVIASDMVCLPFYSSCINCTAS
jgi:hypothetical protein